MAPSFSSAFMAGQGLGDRETRDLTRAEPIPVTTGHGVAMAGFSGRSGDGTSGAEMVARLTGINALSGADFIL
ncbi:MAG: hypothetical protein IT542_13115 [Rubellimicrobium sp.]|nr:hypothetical protein [Rubellimicrobium sp.]